MDVSRRRRIYILVTENTRDMLVKLAAEYTTSIPKAWNKETLASIIVDGQDNYIVPQTSNGKRILHKTIPHGQMHANNVTVTDLFRDVNLTQHAGKRHIHGQTHAINVHDISRAVESTRRW